MAASASVRVRRSLIEIQKDYDSGKKKELEDLMRAWKGIKELPHDQLQSFFTLGGYHGEPFRGEGATNPLWWGGYCQHGTVLFPTWHRAYLHALERALQSIEGCADVTLPFWDECSDESLNYGIPRALTDEKFELDGVIIANPLRSFVFPVAIDDPVENKIYAKPKGYETVRYPLSGLVGTTDDQTATAAHNAMFPSYPANVMILNANVVSWLTWPVVVPQPNDPNGNDVKPVTLGLIHKKFVQCLDAPNYTVFSNTTSSRQYNGQTPKPPTPAVSLESPHNAVHLAVGGYDVPGTRLSVISGANGDMGENETAGLDPIFFFHHCFIDYAFWIWQQRHGATGSFTIDTADPGAKYVVSQDSSTTPPAYADVDKPMDMDTALKPFTNANGALMTSKDVVDIEQLGYKYGPGSLDKYARPPASASLTVAAAEADTRIVHVGGLDRSRIRGSFVIAAFAEIDGRRQLIDLDPVLSRWNVEGCANCQNHLETTADFEVSAQLADSVEVQVHTRGGVLGEALPAAVSAGLVESVSPVPDFPFTVEIR